MDIGLIIGFAAIGIIGVANILAVAYTFGKLKQQVEDMGNRVERLEGIQNSKDRDARQKTESK